MPEVNRKHFHEIQASNRTAIHQAIAITFPFADPDTFQALL